MRTASIGLCLALIACAPPTLDETSESSVSEDLEDFTPGATFRRFLEINGGKLSWSEDLFESITRPYRRELVPDTERRYTAETAAFITIPHGRSLERRRTDFAQPRILAAYPLDGVSSGLRDRIFIGYTPRLAQLEIIAPNEKGTGNGGYTDFAVVRDFRPGGTPEVIFPQAGVCMACHKGGQPLHANPWQEQVRSGWFSVSNTSNTVTLRADTPLDPSLHPMFLGLEPLINNYAFAAEAEFEAKRMYGRAIIGMLTDRVVDPARPLEFHEGQDPLIDPQYFPSNTTPQVLPTHVEVPDTSGGVAVRCNDWRNFDPRVSEERGQELYGKHCAGCHASNYGAQFDIPLFSLEAAAQKDFAKGRANPSRNSLYLVENCLMPPAGGRRTMSEQERADLIGYLRDRRAAQR